VVRRQEFTVQARAEIAPLLRQVAAQEPPYVVTPVLLQDKQPYRANRSVPKESR
jgi:hypothetical protein